jgi:ribonucleoside-diphosphate reductase beta chain
LEALHLDPVFGSRNPFDFMELQDVQELTNFFERRVYAYQVDLTGEVVFAEEF